MWSSETINPNYNPEKLNWRMITFDRPGLSYEFDILCFWKTPEGLILSASDSGCSCPSPFEDYEGKTAIEIEQKLERVKDFNHAKELFNNWNNAWNREYEGKPYALFLDELKQLEELFSEEKKET